MDNFESSLALKLARRPIGNIHLEVQRGYSKTRRNLGPFLTPDDFGEEKKNGEFPILVTNGLHCQSKIATHVFLGMQIVPPVEQPLDGACINVRNGACMAAFFKALEHDYVHQTLPVLYELPTRHMLPLYLKLKFSEGHELPSVLMTEVLRVTHDVIGKQVAQDDVRERLRIVVTKRPPLPERVSGQHWSPVERGHVAGDDGVWWVDLADVARERNVELEELVREMHIDPSTRRANGLVSKETLVALGVIRANMFVDVGGDVVYIPQDAKWSHGRHIHVPLLILNHNGILQVRVKIIKALQDSHMTQVKQRTWNKIIDEKCYHPTNGGLRVLYCPKSVKCEQKHCKKLECACQRGPCVSGTHFLTWVPYTVEDAYYGFDGTIASDGNYVYKLTSSNTFAWKELSIRCAHDASKTLTVESAFKCDTGLRSSLTLGSKVATLLRTLHPGMRRSLVAFQEKNVLHRVCELIRDPGQERQLRALPKHTLSECEKLLEIDDEGNYTNIYLPSPLGNDITLWHNTRSNGLTDFVVHISGLHAKKIVFWHFVITKDNALIPPNRFKVYDYTNFNDRTTPTCKPKDVDPIPHLFIDTHELGGFLRQAKANEDESHI